MASYFDLPPQQKAGAADIAEVPEDQRKQLGRVSVLSPAVTQILDDLGAHESDSDSEAGDDDSISESDNTKQVDDSTKKSDFQRSRQDKGLDKYQPANSSPLPSKDERSSVKGSANTRLSPTRSSGSSKPRQPHMARFHSLRSMLFSSTIEGKMKQVTHEETEREEQAANKWKSQHEQRQIPSRPKTPEKDGQGKGQGLGSRLKTSIRRMTSKEVPTMDTLKEDGTAHDFSDHGSTASSNYEPEPYQWKPREADESSIDHSDVEDLVRWVSRRDPPSDGEARTGNTPAITLTEADNGHDSIGDSDVDDLVRWASRKSSGLEPATTQHTGYSDASTESDSEMLMEHDTSEDEDADDLVRWISHRDGPTAGPVRQARGENADRTAAGSQVRHNSDVPEFNQWVKRMDGTSDNSGAASSTLDAPEEQERGRPLSREGRPKAKGHITHDDINDLVKWVSRKDSKQSPQQQEKDLDELQQQESANKQQLSMTVDEGSLSHSDVKDLIEHVRSTDVATKSDTPVAHDPEATKLENQQEAKKQQVGMTVDEGSLSHSDVKELLEHVKTTNLAAKADTPFAHDPEAAKFESQQEAKKQQLGMTVDEGSLSHSDVKELLEHVKTSDLAVPGSNPTVQV